MTWETFLDINREIFAPAQGWSKTTFWKLAVSAAAAAGVIGAYWKVLDDVAHGLIGSLVVPAGVEASLKAWDGSPHFFLRTMTALLSLAVVYAGAFFLTAQERLDYRSRVAESLGVRFTAVRREHDVLDATGRCRMTSTEELHVYDLHLSHIERRLQVTSATARTKPDISISGEPDGTTYNTLFRDEGSSRYYVINFLPALHRTADPVRLRMSEEVEKAIWMFEQDAPEQPAFNNSRVEFVSFFVIEPIERLELSVTFPYNYRAGGQSQIGVRYGRTSTVHDVEEQRLRNSVFGKIANGRQTLSLEVEKPVIGLQYYLYWVPPRKP